MQQKYRGQTELWRSGQEAACSMAASTDPSESGCRTEQAGSPKQLPEISLPQHRASPCSAPYTPICPGPEEKAPSAAPPLLVLARPQEVTQNPAFSTSPPLLQGSVRGEASPGGLTADCRSTGPRTRQRCPPTAAELSIAACAGVEGGRGG